MKKKRLFSLLLAGALTMSLAACGGQEGVTNNASENSSASGEETGTQASAETQTEEASVKPETPSGQLIFGFITDLEGEFYDTAFNNTATNYKAYNLIHGYETVTYTKEDEFVYNPTVVKSHEEVENEDGTKTYTVTINDGLTWNDGTHTGSITLNGVSWDSVKFYCAANGDGDLTKQSDYEELKNKGAFAAISSH